MLTSAMSWQSPETESRLSSNTPSMVMFLKTSRRPCTSVWSWQKTSAGAPASIPSQPKWTGPAHSLVKTGDGVPNPPQFRVLQGQCTLGSENTSPMWDPQQKHLQDKLEFVHWQAACHICGDLSHTSGASALVKKKKWNSTPWNSVILQTRSLCFTSL